ncbi:MAG: hypothetical protein NZ480_08345 [Bdellovibrionaceae bacterium]|nr:hypothetical protein [Pseudobdellovibrionaceae bacterium]MDW8190616.1 hypothetical protein [Pseudobdellovibrionaceae bacterium]
MKRSVSIFPLGMCFVLAIFISACSGGGGGSGSGGHQNQGGPEAPRKL